MRYALFSDVHANLEAFKAVIAALKTEKADKTVFLGDIVGYGCEPNQCIEELIRLDPVALAGNHDQACSGSFSLDHFNSYALESIVWTKSVLKRQNKNFLSSLKIAYSDQFICCSHGAFYRPEKFFYVYSPFQAEKDFERMQTSLLFMGHTHVPLIFEKKGNKIKVFYKDCENIKKSSKYIINVGSVGQPRDGNPRAAYVIYDTKKRLVELKRISYNINKAQSTMKRAGIAEFLAQRLGQGR
jgi:predicted phosphodiesterase